MGLQLVEKSLPSGRKDEEKKEEKRRIYWYLVQTDLMFRLLYDKPPCIEEQVVGVRPPSVIRPAKMPQLSACETVLQVIWTRAVVIGVEYFDSINTDGSVRSEGDNNTIDSCCAQIENLLADWDLVCSCHKLCAWYPLIHSNATVERGKIHGIGRLDDLVLCRISDCPVQHHCLYET